MAGYSQINFFRLPFGEKLKNIPGLFGIRTNEQPHYYVIKKDGDIQIRKYRPFTVAHTLVKANYGDASKIGFQRLYRYVSGRNADHDVMKMTAPVFQARGERLSVTSPIEVEKRFDGWMMSFILPARFAHIEPPTPLDPNVKIIKIPSLVVASLRFSGNITEALMDERTNELTQWVENKTNYNIVSEPRFGFYDPPFVIPLFRRNEVHLTLSEKGKKLEH